MHGSVDQTLGLALQHHQAGRLSEAERLYRQVLAIQPGHVDALHLLGVVANQAGRSDLAIELIQRAIAAQPNFPQAHSNLGMAYFDLGEIDKAITAWHRAIKQQPDLAEAWSSLGNAQRISGNCEQAIGSIRRAIELQPASADAFGNLGLALADAGRLDGAIDAFRQAIALRPRDCQGYRNLSAALDAAGHWDQAIAACRQSIAIKDDCAAVHYNLALMLLRRGNFAEGWTQHEWRWRIKNFASPRWNFPQPRWDGSDMPGRTLLVHAEQGLGDTIQFIRYMDMIFPRVGELVVVCQPPLRRLLEGAAGISRLFVWGEPLPAFDAHCPMMSLPLLFGTTLDTIPRSIPYLRPDPVSVDQWRARLPNTPFLRAGLAWAGSRTHANDRNRSIPLSALAALNQVPGVEYWSLQVSESAPQAQSPPPGLKLVDYSAQLYDLAETAALIANLDLVISVDTAVAHLAGAMGKPVWTLLPFAADWRWLTNRNDAPWYPTMQLFRQAAPGDWPSAIAIVAQSLKGKESQLR